MSDFTLKLPEHSPGQRPTKTPPTGNERLEAVALALEARGSQTTCGYEGIEYKGYQEVGKAPVKGTVFGWIAEELDELGVQTPMDTVDETLAALGIRGGVDGVDKPRHKGKKFLSDDVARHSAAHHIGCHCHGAVITANAAAGRVRSFKR